MTNAGLDLVSRVTGISRQRPQAPRDPGYENGVVKWRHPADQSAITHYRVRVDTDAGSSHYTVPGDCTRVAIESGGTKAYLYGYNAIWDTQSPPVVVTLTTVNGSFQSLVKSYTLTVASTAIANPSETTNDGDMLAVYIDQDATGGRRITWGTEFKTPTVDIDTTANTRSIFKFDRKDSKWWLTAWVTGQPKS